MSGVPIGGGEDGILSKDQSKTPGETQTPDHDAEVGGDRPAGKSKNIADEGSDLTEQSDDDDAMLQVHD